MRCDYCGAEMSKTGNMYICNDCFTTYILNGDVVEKKYIVSEDFAKEYSQNRAIISSNNNDKKFAVVQRLLQMYSNSPALWNVLGVIYRGRNQVTDAIRCYEKALNLNPNYAQVLVNSAIAYLNANDLEKANKNMERAYEQMNPSDSNYALMLGNYALILGKMGDLERATQFINEAEARGYQNAHIIRKELSLKGEKKENSGKGFFGKLLDGVQSAKEDAAVKKAYQAEVEKRKPHVRKVKHERALTPQEQQTIDMIEVERNQKIAQWSKEGVGFFEATFTRALPYDQKIEEIRNRAIWYEEVTIPPEVDPSVPIVIDEEAIRRSVRK